MMIKHDLSIYTLSAQCQQNLDIGPETKQRWLFFDSLTHCNEKFAVDHGNIDYMDKTNMLR
jgi:hypothetical protein